jgi:hypothetical protein
VTAAVVPLPKQVEVGGYVFPIYVVPRRHSKLGGDDGCSTYDGGFAIYIADDMSIRKGLDIVLHEVTHAINFANDIDDGVDEETIATKHGPAWAQFLLDNPKFQRWLNSALNRIRKERANA